MKDNESLRLTVRFKELVQTDLSHAFYDSLPARVIEDAARPAAGARKSRERVFTPANTVFTMLLNAVQEDRSLQNGLNLFKGVFESRSRDAARGEEARLAAEKAGAARLPKKPGRPKAYRPRLPKSMQKPVSANTAAYSKARTGLGSGVAHAVFAHSAEFGDLEKESWHGMKTYITDGTFVQLQDTPDIKLRYVVKGRESSCPQALLQVMIRQGSGQVKRLAVGSRQESELALVLPMLDGLEAGDLLLADDLYNSYYHFSRVLSRKAHIIVPGKRERKYKVVDGADANDQTVEITRTNRPGYVGKRDWGLVPGTLLLRRVTYRHPTKNGMEESVLCTTLLDRAVTPGEIIAKHAPRWDIEISIREIKTLMGIGVLRSKSADMAHKELRMALAAYNLVRKIIARSAGAAGFPPQDSVFQKCAALGRPVLLDKKGRVFFKRSPGRNGHAPETDK